MTPCSFKAECIMDLSPAQVFDFVAITGPASQSKKRLQKSVKVNKCSILEHSSEYFVHTVLGNFERD